MNIEKILYFLELANTGKLKMLFRKWDNGNDKVSRPLDQQIWAIKHYREIRGLTLKTLGVVSIVLAIVLCNLKSRWCIWPAYLLSVAGMIFLAAKFLISKIKPARDFANFCIRFQKNFGINADWGNMPQDDRGLRDLVCSIMLEVTWRIKFNIDQSGRVANRRKLGEMLEMAALLRFPCDELMYEYSILGLTREFNADVALWSLRANTQNPQAYREWLKYQPVR